MDTVHFHCIFVCVFCFWMNHLLRFYTFSLPAQHPYSDASHPSGWDKHSYGYHGDDGHSFCSSGTGQPYGPTFTTGDVIGCCVNLINNTCFYTKNGHSLGKELRSQSQIHNYIRDNAYILLCGHVYSPVEKCCQYTVMMYWYLLIGTKTLNLCTPECVTGTSEVWANWYNNFYEII